MKKIRSLFTSLLVSVSLIFCSISFVNAASYVANVRLYSTLQDNHSWLVIKNTSSSSIYVGGYLLAANNSVTIGIWGNITQHKGIWYNLEGYYSMASNVSVSKNITSSELSSMNYYINLNDRWGYLYNCSSFATSVWNTISSVKVSAGLVNTPGNLANSIKSKFSSSYSNNYAIPSKSSSQLGYYSTSSSYVKAVPKFASGGGSSSFSRTALNQNLHYDDDFINSFEPLNENYNY